MRKLVRKSVQAALLTGGFLVVSAVGASAGVPGDGGENPPPGGGGGTVVACETDVFQGSVVGDNSILSGNNLTAPICVPIVENQVSVAGIGAAVNGDDSEGALGILGVGSTGGGGYDGGTVVVTDTETAQGSWIGDNSIGSGNSLGAPIDVPVVENQGSGTGIGGAVNFDDSEAALGLLGLGSTGYAGDEYNGAEGSTVVVPETSTEQWSVVGDNSIGSGNNIAVPITVPIVENQVAIAGIGAAVNGDDSEGALGILGVGSTGGGYEGDGTVVGGGNSTAQGSWVGDNSILSGNNIAVPIYVPVVENQVAGTGIGGAVNVDDSEAALGLLGLGSTGGDMPLSFPSDYASILPAPAQASDLTGQVSDLTGGAVTTPLSYAGHEYNGAAGSTVVATESETAQWSEVGDNSIGSGNNIAVPVNVPVVENQVAGTGIGGAVNGDDSEVAVGAAGAGLTGGEGNGTVVASDTETEQGSSVGDNSIGSGNNIAVPVTAPVAENQVALTGIGGAVNLDDSEAALGLLGLGSTL